MKGSFVLKAGDSKERSLLWVANVLLLLLLNIHLHSSATEYFILEYM